MPIPILIYYPILRQLAGVASCLLIMPFLWGSSQNKVMPVSYGAKKKKRFEGENSLDCSQFDVNVHTTKPLSYGTGQRLTGQRLTGLATASAALARRSLGRSGRRG